ncbi:MAG: YhbY family RNA-binding protein [Pseudomonadota bacterium]
MNKPDKRDIKRLRAIGHKLSPVVTVAGKGLTDAVLAELDRALHDHELIKIKLAVGGRDAKAALTQDICERSAAKLVQSIGNVILILRNNPNPDPRLSNLLRPL